MQNMRKARALVVVTAAALLTSAGVSGASNTASAEPEQQMTAAEEAAANPAMVVKETTLADGSEEATGTVTINTADLTDVASRVACGPSITDADIERWMTSGSTTGQPVGTGPDNCGAAAREVVGEGSGIRIPQANPHCYGKNMSGNDMHVKACTTFDVKKKAQGRTWWNQKSFLTIWSNDGQHGDGNCFDCDNPKRLSAYVKYDLSRVSEWAPSVTTTPEGSCNTTSTTVTVNGVSSTQNTTRCPESFGPWALGTHSSGARWNDNDGAAVGKYRAANHHHIASTSHGSDTIKWQWYARWD